MATKTSLQNAIDTALSIVIAKAKILIGLNNIIDELYTDIIIDTEVTTNVLTKQTSETFTYTAIVSKSGNKVNLNVKLTNTGTILINGVLILISNSIYIPNDDYTETFSFVSTNGIVSVSPTTNKIKFFDAIGVGQTVSVNINYTTND